MIECGWCHKKFINEVEPFEIGICPHCNGHYRRLDAFICDYERGVRHIPDNKALNLQIPELFLGGWEYDLP